MINEDDVLISHLNPFYVYKPCSSKSLEHKKHEHSHDIHWPLFMSTLIFMSIRHLVLKRIDVLPPLVFLFPI